ncbi:MAG: DNA mismatch repair protein [Myxococcota bacterium]|nr:DNA mismatch repair protein [Myxococcota bacterium]
MLRSRRQQGWQSDSRRRARRVADGAQADGPPSFYVQPVGAALAVAGGPQVPDLLHEVPRPWGDLRGSAELVRFAFEGGDCEGVFDTLIEALPLAPTDLVAESFASQLYLDELIRSCLHVKIDGARAEPNAKLLRRILETPPAGAEDCAARQRVLAELVARPSLRGDLERLYVAVGRLRDALSMPTAAEPNLVRRKIAVLVALQQCVNAMADGFDETESVLRRLREAGTAIRAREAWARLAQLIDLEGNIATVDVRLRLGSDGTIRGFGVLAIRENPENDLLPGPVRRFFQRVFSWLRGYRYGESEIVVRLLEEVFAPLADDVVELLAITGALELYLAAMGFRDLAIENGLAVSLPEIVAAPPIDTSETAERTIEGLFNPLLFLQGVTPKPCDVPIARHDALVVITGPNSGGKTRLLQSLALTQLLGQVGIFVPAAKARLVRAPKLFLSLVVDGDAAQVEGRLGTELLRIRQLFEQLEPGSLAILDELCSGTNPMEGESIFELVVSLLPRLRPQVFVSTHFLGLAARLERDRPVESLAFLQVELDRDEKPTFQFVPGVATTSLAHKVAARLGVTREELQGLVDAKITPAR